MGRSSINSTASANAHIRVVDLKLGDESIELMQFLGAAGAPVPADARSNDLSFQHVAIIVSDMDAGLRGAAAEPRAVHLALSPDSAGVEPERRGHQGVLLPGPRWASAGGAAISPRQGRSQSGSRPTDRLFLGIDHTAIAVSNTDASLAFYGTLLGMRVAGESDNYGFEQEHLNNVFGAHLRITALRSPSGIGVEFLEYIAPRDGQAQPRRMPARPTSITTKP